jgi:hypothetical protein
VKFSTDGLSIALALDTTFAAPFIILDAATGT